MLFYEINLLISPNLNEAEISSSIEVMEKELQKYGKVDGTKLAERKKLAYPILKQTESWFYFLNLYPEAQDKKELLDSVEKMLKENKDILRSLIIKKDTKKTEAPAKPMRTRPMKTAEIIEETVVKENPRDSKAQSEEIDQKINEMLEDK